MTTLVKNRYRHSLTNITLNGVDVYVGVKLPRAEGLERVHVPSDALGGGAVRAPHWGWLGRWREGNAVLRLFSLLKGGVVWLFLLSLTPDDVMDPQKHAVVHDP